MGPVLLIFPLSQVWQPFWNTFSVAPETKISRSQLQSDTSHAIAVATKNYSNLVAIPKKCYGQSHKLKTAHVQAQSNLYSL